MGFGLEVEWVVFLLLFFVEGMVLVSEVVVNRRKMFEGWCVYL